MRLSVLVWELMGIVLITLVGSFLHFLFDLSGGLLPVVLIVLVVAFPTLTYFPIHLPLFQNPISGG